MTHELSLRDQPITSMEKSHDGDSLALTAGKEVMFVSFEKYVRAPFCPDFVYSRASLYD